MTDPGIDGRGVREGVWGACLPGIFTVTNAVADPGIDGRGRERGVAPQVYLESVMITTKKRNIKLHWLSTRKYCEAFNEMLRVMAHH